MAGQVQSISSRTRSRSPRRRRLPSCVISRVVQVGRGSRSRVGIRVRGDSIPLFRVVPFFGEVSLRGRCYFLGSVPGRVVQVWRVVVSPRCPKRRRKRKLKLLKLKFRNAAAVMTESGLGRRAVVVSRAGSGLWSPAAFLVSPRSRGDKKSSAKPKDRGDSDDGRGRSRSLGVVVFPGSLGQSLGGVRLFLALRSKGDKKAAAKPKKRDDSSGRRGRSRS